MVRGAMRRRRARALATVCAAGVLVVGSSGCGSDDSVSESTAGLSTTQVATVTTRSTTASATASAGTSSPPSASGRIRRSESTTPSVVYRPPYIDHVEWTDTAVGPSLSVFPTTSGRYTDDPAGMVTAWQEVLALDPSADTPGMQAQFDCHWRFARIVDPEKTSWNLEPGRPVVTEQEMIAARCNPGFAEEY
ncbi:DUF2599 domain-containing protein [Gordonia aurantiaca]|uniref:DUF2599 domain-containing protein n=1 Tax=Gordonia sp. B21 TaxID=3151852 RepID=UPI003264E153